MSKLTQHQQEIYDQITETIETKVSTFLKSSNIEDYLLSLRGAAGTGKTFLTTQIAKYLSEKQKELDYPQNAEYRFTITAPTHKAVGVLAEILRENSIDASCKTIHSFLGIKPFVDYDTGEEKYKIDKTKKNKEFTSILMVDESSMVGSELYEYILEAIEDGRVNLVLFIGDPYQLLPINDSENKIYKLKTQYSLIDVVRQARDNTIIKIATKLRERIKSKDFIDLQDFFAENARDAEEIDFFHNKDLFEQDFYKNEKWYHESKIIATYKNKDVDAFNRTIRLKYWEQKGVKYPDTLLPGDMLRFKEAYSVGDVTLYHNGQVVTLESVEKKLHDSLGITYWECKEVYSPKEQIFRVVDPESMKVFNDKLSFISGKARAARFPEGKFLWKVFYETRDMFADVQYVHASTVHKLQGSTYDTAYIDLFSLVSNRYLSDDEKYRLVYVAITRASQNVKIFIPSFIRRNLKIGNAGDPANTVEKFDSVDELLKKVRF